MSPPDRPLKSPPSLSITLTLERRPVVVPDWLDDGDEARFWQWVDANPALRELVDRALALAEARQAA